MNDDCQSNLDLANIPQPEKLKFITKLAYGAGDMGTAITGNILVFFLLYFFTQVAGLPPGLAGIILMIGKIADAINDPIVGVMSDRSRSRFGRRLPWMLCGAIPFGILFFLQWIVPHFSNNESIDRWLLFAYYVFIGIVFNIAFTIVNLPYTALTPELTQDYNERTNLNSFRFTFSIGGSILSLLLAGIIFDIYSQNLIEQYQVLGFICALLSVIPIFWCVMCLQERGARPILNRRAKKILGQILIAIGIAAFLWAIAQIIFVSSDRLAGILAVIFAILIILFGISLLLIRPEPHLIDRQAIRSQIDTDLALSFGEQLKIVFANKPFLYVIGIYLCSWLAVQLTASVMPYFVVSWMGLPNKVFPQVALAVQGTALVMLYVGSFLSRKFGKKAVYFMGMSLWIITQGGLFFLQPGQVSLMYFLAFLAGFGVSVAYLIPWSMMPDVIELDELKTGQRREGIFYGFMVLLQKIGLALGLFLVGLALEWSGFIESAAGQPSPTQPASALLAIRIAIGPLPTLCLIGGLFLAYFYPITEEVHAQIRLQLKERER
jgi:GPH family glycoside/pentoside/hexuronide:cation symporter